MATMKTNFILSASVQKKNGKLHLVYSHFDPIQKTIKPKWKAMGLVENEKKSVVEKRKREMLAQIEADELRLREGYNDPSYYPLVKFLNDWLENSRKKRLQESTYQGYKSYINSNIKIFFGEKVTLADCKPRLMYDFYDWLREKELAESTVLHYHSLLHAAFQYAVRQEIFDFNPLSRVDRPKPKKYQASHYSVEEVKTLEALSENDPLYIPIILAAYCGVRRSEALGLSWSNVDFGKNEIRIYQKVMEIKGGGKTTLVISDEMKNETSRRIIPMVPMVAEALKKQKARQEQNRLQFRKAYSTKYLDMVCVDAVGDLLRPNYVTTHFRYLLDKLGLRSIRFHDLRHTCASLLVESDINMKTIQMWLGHSSMKTTVDINYLHKKTKSKSPDYCIIAMLKNSAKPDELCIIESR